MKVTLPQQEADSAYYRPFYRAATGQSNVPGTGVGARGELRRNGYGCLPRSGYSIPQGLGGETGDIGWALEFQLAVDGQHGDAVYQRPHHLRQLLGVAGPNFSLGLPLDNGVDQHPESRVPGGFQLRVSAPRANRGSEHNAVMRLVGDGEIDISDGHIVQVGVPGECAVKEFKARQRKIGQKRILALKMPVKRRAGDADARADSTQGQRRYAFFANCFKRRLDEGTVQVAVVIGLVYRQAVSL